jgi:hypothetical protein
MWPTQGQNLLIDALSPWIPFRIYFARSVSLAVHWPQYWHRETFVFSKCSVLFQQNDTFPRYAANCLTVPNGPIREPQQTALPGHFVGEWHIYLGCLGLLTISENGIVVWVHLALDQEKPWSLPLSLRLFSVFMIFNLRNSTVSKNLLVHGASLFPWRWYTVWQWTNLNGTVGIVTKLLATQRGVWSPAGERVFSTMPRRGFVVHTNSYSVGTGGSFLGGGGGWIGRETGQPLSFVSCRGQETMEVYLQSPLMPLWYKQGEPCL